MAVSIDRFHSSKPTRVWLLTSPKAGNGSGREELPRLVALLQKSNVPCQVIQSVDELRRQLCQTGEDEESVVVAAGGDGTLSLAASLVSRLIGRAGESNSPQAVSLVPMPLGTENLLARQFGFTRTAEEVATTIRFGAPRLIDAGLANGRIFLIMATSGFDADVVRRLHLTRRGHIRRLSYMLPILRSLWKYSFPTLQIRMDSGESIECAWAMVFNLPQYGGDLTIEPAAIADDGLFDVIAFRSGSILSGLRYLVEIWFGWHLANASVVRARASAVSIESELRVPYQLDGDYVGRLPLKIEMLPRSVRLLMPVPVETCDRDV